MTAGSSALEARFAAPPLPWKRLFHAAALSAVVVNALIAVALTDLEGAVLTVILVVGVALARWRERVGAVVLAVLFADMAFWTIPASVSLVAHGDGLAALLVQVPVAAISTAGLPASIAVATRRDGSGAPLILALTVAVAATGAVLAGAARGEATSGAADAAIALVDTAFSPAELEVDPAATLSIRNEDYFWHTFTVPELELEVRVPGNAVRELRIDATAGTYDFLCRVPGHDRAGMTGTLVVTSSAP